MKLKKYMELLVQAGIPYVWRGQNISYGSDCSGLVQELLRFQSKKKWVDKTSHEMYTYHKAHSLPCTPQTGAVIYYGPDKSNIKHCAMFYDSETICEAGEAGRSATAPEIGKLMPHASVRFSPYAARNGWIIAGIFMP